jgi:hypothetical protein
LPGRSLFGGFTAFRFQSFGFSACGTIRIACTCRDGGGGLLRCGGDDEFRLFGCFQGNYGWKRLRRRGRFCWCSGCFAWGGLVSCGLWFRDGFRCRLAPG